MKICKLTAFLMTMLSMLLIPSLASADPLDPDHVPANAKWVIHVDLEGLSGTALADQVRQKRPEMAIYARQWIRNQYGIDPREDLDGLTMFSDTYAAHTGTAILKANFDRDKVKTELKNNPNARTESWQDLTLYTVTKGNRGARVDEGNQRGGADQQQQQQRGDQRRSRANRMQDKSITIVLLEDDKVVFASSADRAKEAVKLLKGDAPSLKGKDSPLLNELPEGAIMYGAATDLQEIKQREGIFPILRQHERIFWAVGEHNGKAFRKLTLIAQSDEVAKQMKTTLEGLVAFGKVWAADSENLTRVVEDAEVTIDGKVVELEGRSDTETVLNALGEVRDRLQQRIDAAGNN